MNDGTFFGIDPVLNHSTAKVLTNSKNSILYPVSFETSEIK
jgi:hypothetical protein